MRPASGSLHARLVEEARTYSPLQVERSTCGRPNYVRIFRKCSGETVAVCHTSETAAYGRPSDPSGILHRPASD